MAGIEHHDIDRELLLQLWQESGIVSVKKTGTRMQKWKQIAENYCSKKSLAEPLDVKVLQNEWHRMIMGPIIRQNGLIGATELKKELAAGVAIQGEIDNQLEPKPPSSPRAARDSVETAAASACSTTTATKEVARATEGAMVVGGQKRSEPSGGNEPRKRPKTIDDVTGHDGIDPKKKMLIEITEIRKEAAEKERLLNDTLLKAAEVELEAKKEFWKTKNKIAKEELEKASADRITALLNKNVAIAKYNRVNRKKMLLPSPPDM